MNSSSTSTLPFLALLPPRQISQLQREKGSFLQREYNLGCEKKQDSLQGNRFLPQREMRKELRKHNNLLHNLSDLNELLDQDDPLDRQQGSLKRSAHIMKRSTRPERTLIGTSQAMFPMRP